MNFRLYLLALLGLAGLLYIGGAAYTHFMWKDIAPQFTPHPPLNQKLLYLQKIWPEQKPVTAVIGASMALNNFDSDYYQIHTGGPVINLGANGLSLSEAWRVYQSAKREFPISHVILLAQFNELKDKDREEFVVQPTIFHRYVRRKISWVEELSLRDLAGFLHFARNEKPLLFGRANYTSSYFTRTGSVPLSIYGSIIDNGRWNALGLVDDGGCQHCGATLMAICQEAIRDGHDFTVIMPPISPYIRTHRPDIDARYQRGRGVMKATVAACGGHFFDVGAAATFADGCFVDFEHLNDRGMRALTELFVGWRHGEPSNKTMPTDCASPVVAGSGGAGARASS